MRRNLMRALALALLALPFSANAAITFVSYGTNTLSSGTTTVTEPSGAAQDDLILAMCEKAGASGVWTDPADFTELDQKQGANPPVLASYLGYKVRGSTAGSGYTFTHTGGAANGRCTLLAFRGVDTSTPLDVTYVRASHYVEKVSDSASAGPAQPITTVTNGAWVIVLMTEASDGSFTAGAPSGYTLRADDQQSNRVITVASKEVATAGTETPGNWTHTSMGSVDSINYTVALKPAGASLPTFTAGPTAGSITTTTIPVTFTSDTTGTVKGTACTNGNAGNAAQTLAGQCSGGGAAVATISEAVTATVPDGATFTGLSASTTYDLSFVIDATTDSSLVSLADQTTSAPASPDFDTGIDCAADDSDTYTCTYDANADADDIFVCVMKKDATAPANGAAVESCSSGIGDATEATTGSSDSIDVDVSMTGGAPPIADIYAVVKEDGGSYSSVDSDLDVPLDPPDGRQYVTKSGSPGAGEKGILDGASPAAVDGDIMDASSAVDSYDAGASAWTLTVNADTTFVVGMSGDSSQQKFTRRFYDVSTAAWSDSSPVLYCINDLTPQYQGPEEYEGDIPYLFERNVAASLELDGVWLDPEGDDVTHNVNNLPTGLSEDGETLSGTPTTFGYYATVQLEATDICGETEDETVQFVVGYRIPDIFAWLFTEESWKTRNLFAAIDADYATAFPHRH